MLRARPAIAVARRQHHAAEPLRDRLAGLGLGGRIEQERGEHRVVDDAVDLDAQRRANARITVFASWQTFAIVGSASTA